MNRCAVLLIAGVMALAAGLMLISCGVLGGPPLDVELQADETGERVMLIWTSPTSGPPDRYAIYFTSLNGSEALVAETTATVYYHDPAGRTGSYRVVAWFGGDSYSAGDEPSTVPVFTDSVRLYELNYTDGLAGFGWNRATGEGTVYDMSDAGSAPFVDMYLTDTRSGHNTPPYSLFSPASNSKDQGAAGVIPSANWKAGYFSDHLSGMPAVLPPVADSVYFDYSDILDTPFNAGCFLPDGHFALVRVLELDIAGGNALLQAWFQTVPGLRLIQR